MANSVQGSAGERRKARLLGVAGAALAALVVFLVAQYGLGMDLHTPASGSMPAMPLNAGFVLFVSLLASVVGWVLLGLLERFTSGGRRAWSIVAIAVAILSLSGPMSGSGITAGNRLALALMHVAVAAVLIPTLSRTAASSAPAHQPATA